MPTNRTIEADQFAVSMKSILDGFDQSLKARVPKAVEKACKKGRTQTKRKWIADEPESSLSRGPYKSGFTYKVDEESLFVTRGTIYNRKYPGLVHLLEKGHNTMGGGRARAKPHLAVEETQEELWKQLLDEVDGAING